MGLNPDATEINVKLSLFDHLVEEFVDNVSASCIIY